MRAAAHLEVARRDGRDVLIDARSEPPFAIRSCAGRIVVVGSAAGPVGGDELEIHAVIGPGANASIGTAAATSVWPGPRGEPSSTRTLIEVGDGGQLCWHPEPVVPIRGADHRATTTVRLTGTARCRVVEEISLGRSGEAPGAMAVEIRVERDGRPLMHHAERYGPGPTSAVTVAGHRHVVCVVVVGEAAGGPRTVVERSGSGARLPVAGDAFVVLAVAADRPAALALLAVLTPHTP